MSDDPFPRDRVALLLRRTPAYLRLSWRLAREPLLNRARRAAVIAAAGYLASPVDLVPGVIPVLGQLDDIAVALAAIRIALAGLSPERRRFHLEAVGLADEDLAADLRTTAVATAWILRAGARATVRAARVGGRAAVIGGRAAIVGAGLALGPRTRSRRSRPVPHDPHRELRSRASRAEGSETSRARCSPSNRRATGQPGRPRASIPIRPTPAG